MTGSATDEDAKRVLRRAEGDRRELGAVANLGGDGERAGLDDQRPAAGNVNSLERLLRVLALLGDAGAVVLRSRREQARASAGRVSKLGEEAVAVEEAVAGEEAVAVEAAAVEEAVAVAVEAVEEGSGGGGGGGGSMRDEPRQRARRRAI